jgi:hypothetical protein
MGLFTAAAAAAAAATTTDDDGDPIGKKSTKERHIMPEHSP